MNRELRNTLLATSSALAMALGASPAFAVTVCQTNASGTVTNPTGTTISCIDYSGGVTTTATVTNNGTIAPPHAYPPIAPGSATGISVVQSGTNLKGNIINNGTITGKFASVNVGGGAITNNTQGAGATLQGSITNNGTLNGVGAGVYVSGVGTVVTGSIINGVNGTISTDNVDIAVEGHASVHGSITNNGVLTTTAASNPVPIYIDNATVGGSVTNNKAITTNAFSVFEFVDGSKIGGSVVNNATMTDTNAGDNIVIYLGTQSIGGSVINGKNGSLTGGYGIAITNDGFNGTVSGAVKNQGTIHAQTKTGIALFAVTVGGAVTNSGTITAAKNGIRIVNTSGVVGSASVGGGVTNSGSITSTGTDFAAVRLSGGTVTNGIVNTAPGQLSATNGVGILLEVTQSNASVITSGGINNQGTITAKTGIAVGGGSTVNGGITNSGSLSGTRAAIDLATLGGGEGVATTIHQTGGTITGSILLSGLGDTIDVTGGAISGNIVGNSATNHANAGTVNFAATNFTTNGTIDVAAINVNSGTLNLGNNVTVFNTFTNHATVNATGGSITGIIDNAAGTFNVTGSFSSSSTFDNEHGATLAIKANTGNYQLTGALTNSGTVTINNNGVLNVGSYVQQSNGALSFITGSSYGGTHVTLQVGGTASLAGTLNFTANFVGIAGEQLVLLESGGLTGAFSTINIVQADGPPVSATNHWAITDVGNDVIATYFGALSTIAGLTPNEMAIADALDTIFTGGGLPTIQTLFNGLSPAQQAALLSQLSSEGYASYSTMALESSTMFSNSVFAALNSGLPGAGGFAQTQRIQLADNEPWHIGAPSNAPWGVWVGGGAMEGTLFGNGNYHALNDTAGGGSAGLDYRFNSNFTAGIAAGAVTTSFNLGGVPQSGTANSYQVAVYGGYHNGPLYVDGLLGYAFDTQTTKRVVSLLGTPALATGNSNGNQFIGATEIGYAFPLSQGSFFTPFADLQGGVVSENAFTETGPTLGNLHVAAQTTDSLRTVIGAQVSAQLGFGWAGPVSVMARAGWAHEFLDVGRPITASFAAAPGTSFTVIGAPALRDAAEIGLGVQMPVTSNVVVFARYDGDWSGGGHDNAVTGGLRVTW